MASNAHAAAEKLFGSALQKAKIVAYKTPPGKTGKPGGKISDLELELFLNPKEISITRANTFEVSDTQGADPAEVRWTKSAPMAFDIKELWFDTYETRESVRAKYIDKLECLLQYVEGTHHAPCVQFIWGKFASETEKQNEYYFYVQSLNVQYSMFLPDGTPVRAKVTMKLIQAQTIEAGQKARPKESPDHAKLYTVKRGNTLQAIAMQEYDDPGEWRRIADTNRIGDPMNLAPGTKLLVPPILK